MTKVAVAGCQGRMGKAILQELFEHPQLQLTVATISPRASNCVVAAGVEATTQLSEDFDVLIDFTSPEATMKNLNFCLSHGKKILIGTTGFTPEQKATIERAGKDISIVLAPNTSVGVNVMLTVLKQTAKAIPSADIHIAESHHIHKKDAPSGTALAMKNTIEEQVAKTIETSSIRAGDIIGEHTAYFVLAGERIEITHRATNRAIFAKGALVAAEWLQQQSTPGLFTMHDVLFN